jgi:hypothetical protein
VKPNAYVHEVRKMKHDSTRYSVAQDICFSPANEDGCIILNVARDSVLSLNGTGALIFANLAANASGLTHAELVAAVQCEFIEESSVRIEAAVANLLHQLQGKGVVREEILHSRSSEMWVHTKLVRCTTAGMNALVTPLMQLKAHTAAAVLMLTLADVLLKFGGFSTLHATVKRWKLKQTNSHDSQTIAKGCAVVEQACVWHPKQKLCLQRSAVVTCLLRSLGIPAEMVIGVHKMPFYGHSWVEVEGRVVNDHKNVQTFFHVLSRC